MRKWITTALALAPLAALVFTAFVLASAGSAKVTLPYAGSAQAASKWTFGTGDLVDSSPNIDGSSVYIGSDDDNVYKLNLSTGADPVDVHSRGQHPVEAGCRQRGRLLRLRRQQRLRGERVRRQHRLAVRDGRGR